MPIINIIAKTLINNITFFLSTPYATSIDKSYSLQGFLLKLEIDMPL